MRMDWDGVELALRYMINGLRSGKVLPPEIDKLLDEVAHERSSLLMAEAKRQVAKWFPDWPPPAA